MSQPARRIRKAIAALAAVLVIIAGSAIVIWRLTWMAPAWYAPPNPSDQAIVELADRVEYRVVQEAQQIRPAGAETWTIRIREEQVNAWLSARLRKWVAHHEGIQWPQNLGTPQVRFDAKGISAALPLGTGEDRRYLLARLTPAIVDGRMSLELERVQLGRVSLPGEPLANLLTTLAESAPDSLQLPQIKTVIGWLEQRESIQPDLDLADGRRLRLIRMELRERAIDITAQTIGEEHDRE